MRVEIVDDFPCSVEALFALFESEALDTAVRAASSSRRDELEDRVEGDVRVRRTRITPSRELPGPLRKLLGPQGLSYVQTSRFDRSSRRVAWSIDVERSAGRAEIAGTVELQPTPAGCRRVVRGDITVRVPLVGSTIEEHIAKDIRRTYARSAVLLEALIAEQPGR